MAVFDLGATYGVVANDSTNDAPGIDAGLAAAAAAKGGTVLFPRGIALMTGDAVQSFGSNIGTLILKGSGGDSAVRFGNTGFNRIEVVSANKVSVEDLTFLGRTDANNEAAQAHLYIGADQATLKNCVFFGLGLAPDSIRGIVFSSSQLSVEGCQFLGCTAINRGVVNLGTGYSLSVKHCTFIDYGTHGTQYYSKNGGAGKYWIYASPAEQLHSRHLSTLIVENVSFDEGADRPVFSDGMRFVRISHCAVNLKGIDSGQGFEIKNAYSAHISNSWIGYVGSTTGKKGVILDNVKYAKLENLIFADGVDTIEIKNGCEKVEIKNCRYLDGADLEGTRLPINISNLTGNSLDLNVDGVRFKNGIVDYR